MPKEDSIFSAEVRSIEVEDSEGAQFVIFFIHIVYYDH